MPSVIAASQRTEKDKTERQKRTCSRNQHSTARGQHIELRRQQREQGDHENDQNDHVSHFSVERGHRVPDEQWKKKERGHYAEQSRELQRPRLRSFRSEFNSHRKQDCRERPCKLKAGVRREEAGENHWYAAQQKSTSREVRRIALRTEPDEQLGDGGRCQRHKS